MSGTPARLTTDVGGPSSARSTSFDRGFRSPANRKKLNDLLDLNALSKKGKLSGTGRMTLS